MSLLSVRSWLEGLSSFSARDGIAELGLGLCIVVLAGLWLWNRRSLALGRSRSEELARRLDAQERRLAELEGARWAADPEARIRRDNELVEMLGSLLSYTQVVREGGPPMVSEPSSHPGAKPCG